MSNRLSLRIALERHPLPWKVGARPGGAYRVLDAEGRCVMAAGVMDPTAPVLVQAVVRVVNDLLGAPEDGDRSTTTPSGPT